MTCLEYAQIHLTPFHFHCQLKLCADAMKWHLDPESVTVNAAGLAMDICIWTQRDAAGIFAAPPYHPDYESAQHECDDELITMMVSDPQGMKRVARGANGRSIASSDRLQSLVGHSASR
jgi:hypothetical protein